MAERVLASRKAPAHFPLLSLSWSPDGSTIAVPGAQRERLHAEMVFVDAATGKERVVDTPELARDYPGRLGGYPTARVFSSTRRTRAENVEPGLVTCRIPKARLDARLTNDLDV